MHPSGGEGGGIAILQVSHTLGTPPPATGLKLHGQPTDHNSGEIGPPIIDDSVLGSVDERWQGLFSRVVK